MIEDTKIAKKENIHYVLAYSYISYFMAFLLGLFFHFIFPIQIYKNILVSNIGFILLISSSLFIFWAQKTSKNFNKENLAQHSFSKGPYAFTRMPTHLGLFFLLFSFGLIINSLLVMLFTTIYFILGKFSFIKKQEQILLNKYGEHYLEYKKIVKF